ncbi:MAG: response regulator [Oscillospiraceae bacterium]|nr:response regulator [Oscillospiraceae bacterium]
MADNEKNEGIINEEETAENEAEEKQAKSGRIDGIIYDDDEDDNGASGGGKDDKKAPPKKKVVMVDDMAFFLSSTKERLKKYYDFFPVTSAEALFELLEDVTPDVILLDVNMPDVDGYKTIKNLKTHEKFCMIPVIFVSGKTDKASMIKAKNYDANDYITKPFNIETLIESIELQTEPSKKWSSRPLVLAVDDNPSVLKAINVVLNEKYIVRTLSKPENLHALLDIISPDLFLLDCKMPVLSGYDLVPIIRASKGHRETPIVFLTSDASVDNISVAISYGTAGFISKPIIREVLKDKIDNLLQDFIIMRRIRHSKH